MQYFLDVLKNKYAQFNGRARRAEYWQFFLFNVIISFVLGFIDGIIFKRQVISALFSVVTLVPSIAVAIRRMHDVGKSGWFVLVPFYNLYLAVTEGTRGPNEYGPDPKETANAANAPFSTPPTTY
jgi:uncharacterized membrane protein YhaH (DUF805 family)